MGYSKVDDFSLTGEKGVEPLTFGFGDHYSTIETIPLYLTLEKVLYLTLEKALDQVNQEFIIPLYEFINNIRTLFSIEERSPLEFPNQEYLVPLDSILVERSEKPAIGLEPTTFGLQNRYSTN